MAGEAPASRGPREGGPVTPADSGGAGDCNMFPSSLRVPGERPGVIAGVGVPRRCVMSWPGLNISDADSNELGPAPAGAPLAPSPSSGVITDGGRCIAMSSSSSSWLFSDLTSPAAMAAGGGGILTLAVTPVRRFEPVTFPAHRGCRSAQQRLQGSTSQLRRQQWQWSLQVTMPVAVAIVGFGSGGMRYGRASRPCNRCLKHGLDVLENGIGVEIPSASGRDA